MISVRFGYVTDADMGLHALKVAVLVGVSVTFWLIVARVDRLLPRGSEYIVMKGTAATG